MHTAWKDCTISELSEGLHNFWAQCWVSFHDCAVFELKVDFQSEMHISNHQG